MLTGVATGSELVSLTRKKVKDGPSGKTLWLHRRQVLDSVILEHARPSEFDVPLRDRILAVLDASGRAGATGPQLIAELEVELKNRSGLYKAANRLVDGGVAVLAGPRGRTYYLAGHAPPEQA